MITGHNPRIIKINIETQKREGDFISAVHAIYQSDKTNFVMSDQK